LANEEIFIKILCTRSFVQLSLTFHYYHRISCTTIEKAIEKEMEGKLKHALLAIIKSNENLPKYFAGKIVIVQRFK
jgi:annexin A3